MPIATKSGGLIVKDGKLAENCGCCGGWYCCQVNECASDFVNSITVQIIPQSSEYTFKSLVTAPCGYNQSSGAVPCSSIAGTHSLSRVSATRWSATLAADSLGCFSPKIELLLSYPAVNTVKGTWSLSIQHSAYWWLKTTQTPSSSFKSLSEMRCENTPDWTGSPFGCARYAADYERYAFSVINRGSFWDFFCSPLGVLSSQIALGSSAPGAGGSDEFPSQILVNTQSGSLSCDVTVSIA